MDQRAKKNGLFELAKKNNTGIIIRTPLVFGYLTGKFTGDDKFSRNDHRQNWSRKQNKKWATSLSLFKFIYKKYKPSQAALRYCLDFKQVSTVIPGMTSPDQVIENVVTSNLPAFTKEDHELIEYIYDTNNFFYKN